MIPVGTVACGDLNMSFLAILEYGLCNLIGLESPKSFPVCLGGLH